MSNSPHPSSDTVKGGFLKAVYEVQWHQQMLFPSIKTEGDTYSALHDCQTKGEGCIELCQMVLGHLDHLD